MLKHVKCLSLVVLKGVLTQYLLYSENTTVDVCAQLCSYKAFTALLEKVFFFLEKADTELVALHILRVITGRTPQLTVNSLTLTSLHYCNGLGIGQG